MLSFLYCSIGVSSCATVLLEEEELATLSELGEAKEEVEEEELTLGRRDPVERRLVPLGKEFGEAMMLLLKQEGTPLMPTDDEYDKGLLELNDLGILRCLTLLCLFKLAFVENFLPQFFALQGKTIAVACRCTWRR